MTSDPKVTAAAKRKIKRVVRKILQTTQRDKPTYLGKRTLTEQTGNLFKRSDFISSDEKQMGIQSRTYGILLLFR